MKTARAMAAVLASTAILAAACSSDSGTTPETSSPAPSTSGSSDSSSSAPADDGLAAAKEFLAKYIENPTDIVIDVPLDKKPDTGKVIVKLTTPQPVTLVVNSGSKQAAEALGWDFKEVPVEATAEGIQQAFTAALQMNPKPDGIIVSGYPKVTFAAQLEQAKAAGIPVVLESATDPAGTGDGIIALIDGPPQVQEWGKMIASYIVSDSEASANVASFNIPAYPILTEYVSGVKAGISEWCAACTVIDVDQQATDVGTKTPQSVVSTLQTNPDIGYVDFAFGDMAIGVSAAMTAAGLSEQAKITGETGTAANIEGIRNGTEAAWIGFPAPIVGVRDIDAFARYFTESSMDPANEAFLPTQIITSENVDGIVQNDAGDYIGLADYLDQFKKLWLVS